ncbi:glycosyltransferase [Desulfobacterota bacterium AH_259_B03_O07]|nr:glycosyltransferase [Desulfobacterota bacterium AH_259_B03_O07]
MTHPFVSVIIPVLNDSERLKTCLRSLENQSYPKSKYEVIVVDNGSEEDIFALAEIFGVATFTRETFRSSYAARNKGISMAKGDVIAFTDSDCIPAEDWIENGVANLLRIANCGLVAGKIEIFFRNPLKPTAVELYESVIAFPQELYVEVQKFGATANLFTFKSVIDRVGAFNDKLKSGGDVDWGNRVFSIGLKLTYADDTIILHPSRNSLNNLYKKHIRIAGGHYELIKENRKHGFVNLISNILEEIFPTRIAIKLIISNEKFKKLNFKQKMKVILVGISARYFRGFEKIRLQFGIRSKS